MTPRRIKRIRVLFVCLHNSTRSRIAEAFLNHLAGDRFAAESAGLEPAPLYLPAVEVMKEIGIDISQQKAKSVFDLFLRCRSYQHVVTICEKTDAERCPTFPGEVKVYHWALADPTLPQKTPEEQRIRTRAIRDQIKAQIEQFIRACPP
jgi:arsenate reductase (thioredoxin)